MKGTIVGLAVFAMWTLYLLYVMRQVKTREKNNPKEK